MNAPSHGSQRPPVVGIIADIVASRALADRASAQRDIMAVFARAEESVPALRSAWATVGDEFQVIVADWASALRLTLRVQALLPESVSLRFGIGVGEINTITLASDGNDHDDAVASSPPIQDGSAWLHARAALEDAETRQRKRDEVRTGFRADDPDLTASVSQTLVLRDHVVARMKARERRLLAAMLQGHTQLEAARSEGISQAAVSQSLHRSGAMALLDADREDFPC